MVCAAISQSRRPVTLTHSVCLPSVCLEALQVVDAAISESMFNMLEGCVPELAAHGATRPPSGSTLTGVVPSGTWRAADGVYVILGGNGNSGGWAWGGRVGAGGGQAGSLSSV